MRRVLLGIIVLVAGLLSVEGALAQERVGTVDTVRISGAIDPASEQLFARAVDRAVADQAEVLIVLLDTPGGLDSSMRAMVQDMLMSPVLVVVFVYPQGGRAASAGVFLAMAAHVAVMAPGTDIGAAHPVSAGGGQIMGDMNDKVTNEAVAYIRSLAELRERNAEWAEQAVRSSQTMTAEEAVKSDVVDLIAQDLPDLIAKLDGRQVQTPSWTRTLVVAGAPLREMEHNFAEQVLKFIFNPNTAYLLFLIGLYAVIAELYSPGAIVPAVVGAIAIVLALVAFGTLPIYWGGVALLLVAAALIAFEAQNPGLGVLGFGGVVTLVLGTLLLYQPLTSPFSGPFFVSPWVLGFMVALTVAFLLLLLRIAAQSQNEPQQFRGQRRIVGQEGLALTALDPEGVVRVAGEEWSARTMGTSVQEGDQIWVYDVDGLALVVGPAPEIPAIST
ncbi:MAG: nodulation protein NfeD [Chloroflexi bacterium]|nr:nodulation protein NfeD [Chloroflexota bacterium]